MSIYKVIQIGEKSFEFKEVRIEDKKLVFNLYNECEDYFYLVEGKKPLEEDAERFFKDIPPGKTIDDKYSFGIYYERKLIGLVDLIENYPKEGEWFLGLLLLNPNMRGIGLGRAVHNILVNITKEKIAKKISIGVVEQNISALKYWNKIGYKEVKRTSSNLLNKEKTTVIVLDYLISV